MLVLDIETLIIGRSTYIWDFGAIETATNQEYHFINSVAVQSALKMLRQGGKVNFFEQNQVDYCLENQTALRLNHKEFYQAIQQVITGAKVISAYNLNFDYGHLKRNRIKFPNNQKKVCLWGSFINAFVNHKYVHWCYDNNYLTEKGYCKTDAQTAYRYLEQPDYKHLHTALSDCWSEVEIWERIKKRKQKLESKCSFHNVKKNLKKLGY